MTHKCMGESWYCHCEATCTFTGHCGKEIHFCDDCKAKYDHTAEQRKKYLDNQDHCKICGSGCGYPWSFMGLTNPAGEKICEKCVPDFMKGIPNE
tara:strand:- start:1130 stop:1414 length:285 start_codon:yes stop_codon:yes gene_type:complete